LFSGRNASIPSTRCLANRQPDGPIAGPAGLEQRSAMRNDTLEFVVCCRGPTPLGIALGTHLLLRGNKGPITAYDAQGSIDGPKGTFKNVLGIETFQKQRWWGARAVWACSTIAPAFRRRRDWAFNDGERAIFQTNEAPISLRPKKARKTSRRSRPRWIFVIIPPTGNQAGALSSREERKMGAGYAGR